MSYVNEIQGKRFGSLTVIGKVNVNRRWEALCRCDCGNEKVVSARGLVRGDTKSCGCQTNKLKSIGRSVDLVGKKFGKLAVIEQGKGIAQGTKRRFNNSWLCKCECGNISEVTSNALLSGNTTSCGCGRTEGKRLLEARLAADRPLSGSLLKTLYAKANIRGIECNLTAEEFDSTVTQNCAYCGTPPNKTVKNSSRKPYHGLDRIDSRKGYIKNNIVACCSKCNFAKHSMELSEFKEHIELMYNHLIKKESPPVVTILRKATPTPTEDK